MRNSRCTRPYFRLRNRASGLEIVHFCCLNGPLLPQNPLEKVGGFAPTFSNGFCHRRGLFRPRKSTISKPEPLLSNLRYEDLEQSVKDEFQRLSGSKEPGKQKKLRAIMNGAVPRDKSAKEGIQTFRHAVVNSITFFDRHIC